MKQRYDTVINKLWSLETRIGTMSKDQSESSCAIQCKLEALLRNSTAQDKLVADRTQGNRVDFKEPQRNKRGPHRYPGVQRAQGQGGQDNHEGWNHELDKMRQGIPPRALI